MRFLKLITVTFIFCAFILQPQKIAQSSCIGFDPDYYNAYQFFVPITFDRFFERYDAADNTQDANLDEWQSYLKSSASREDIAYIIYTVTAEDMQNIRAYTEGKRDLYPSELKQNGLVQHWKNKPDIEAIDYLYYAKVCEPHAWKQESWNIKPEKDIQTMRWLSDAGKKYYAEKASNVFLKLRFAYQAIRMAHYVEQPRKAIQFYDELVANMSTESIIKQWALAHKAGALASIGEYPQANYIFSRLFDECPSKQVSSYLSINFYSDDVWQATLDQCKNESEKSTLYFIRSLDKNSKVIEEIQSVYAIEPTSNKLPIMLMHAINQLEYNLLSVTPTENLLFYKGYQSYPKQEAIKNLMTTKSFIEKVLKETKIQDLGIWTLAAGYLDYVAGTPQKALQTFAELKKKEKNKDIKAQITLFETAIAITQLKKIDDKTEDEIYQEVKKVNNQQLTDLMLEAFALLYQKQGENAKAYLCKGYIDNIKITPDLALIKGMQTLADKKNTLFEKEVLLTKIDYRALDANSKVKPKHILKEIEATVLFSQDKLKEALVIYEQIPEEAIYTIEEDPFDIRIKDYKNTEPSLDKGKYNRKMLATKLLLLKDLAEKNTVEQADYYYQLGAAYYNMTFFGNAWIAIDYFRSSLDFDDARTLAQKGKNAETNTVVFADCSKAKFYFDRAMKAAVKRGDRELAAKACFMAAKCEQNQYYLTSKDEPDYWNGFPPSFLTENRRYFQQLANEYKDTKYYQEVLNECSYFHEFVRK